MTKKNQSDDKIDMFYGFWKYLGVIGIFFIGVTLTWWGVDIMFNDWVRIRTAMGPIGNMVIMPLVIGVLFAGLSFVSFIKMIRED